MYPIVEKLKKINSFKECAIPSPADMYRKFGYINAEPAGSDGDEAVSYNRSSKIDILNDAVRNASSNVEE